MTYFLTVILLVGGQWVATDLTDMPTQYKTEAECMNAMRFVTVRVIARVEGLQGIGAHCQKLKPS